MTGAATAGAATMDGAPPTVAVVGGGLAGITAALDAADAGARVVLVERRGHLGGATWSFRRGDAWFDNGQHVFLRCCTAYRELLARLGVEHLVHLQPRMDVTVVRPGGPTARLRRDPVPVPLHLGRSLLRYRHLTWGDRARLAGPVAALRRMDPTDPALDRRTFGDWLAERGQSRRAVEALWDLICLPTVNLHARDASLALAAKVFRTGLLTEPGGADIGWSRVPLGRLHGDAAADALRDAGVEVRTGARVSGVVVDADVAGGLVVHSPDGDVAADAVVLAVPHDVAPHLAPPEAGIDADALARLGASPIVNVHLVFDRPVMRLPFAAAVGSPVQFVFDRTDAAGVRRGQALAVSLSAADDVIGERPEPLIAQMHAAVADLFPAARTARLDDAVVTRERAATFRGVPGSAARRPGPDTALAGLTLAGAWTATGWPATMEGAVRSGHAAARRALLAVGRSRRLPEEVPT
jgi:squalene-associated FAD-dependent desaturase